MAVRTEKRIRGGGNIPPPLKHRSTIFSRQPLLFLAVALAAGAAMGFFYKSKGGSLLPLLLGMLVLTLAAVLCRILNRSGWTALLALGAFLLGGMLLTAASLPDWYGLWEESGHFSRVTGHVAARRSGVTADTLILDGLQVEDGRGKRNLAGRLALTVGIAREDERMAEGARAQGWQPGSAGALRVGDRLLLKDITLALPTDPAVEGAFNGRRYWVSQNVRFTTYVQESGVLYQPGGGPARWVDSFRQWLDHRLTEDLGEQGAALARALLLGRTADIQDQQEAYNNLGIIHVLSVSGLHVSLLMAAADWVARKYRWPMVPRQLLQWLLIGVYYLLVGVIPSFNRVLLMAAIPLVARMLCRESDPVNTLSLAFCLQLLMTPLGIFSVSLQLTYLAALAMLLLGEGLMKRPLVGSMALSLAIAWAIMPFARSSGFPVMVGLANSLLTPIFSVLVAGCFLYLPLAPIGPLAVGYGGLLGRLCAGSQALVTQIGRHFPLFRVPFQGVWGLAVLSGALVLAAAPRLLGKRRWIRIGCLAAAVAVMLGAVAATQGKRAVQITALFSGTDTALWLEDGGSAVIAASAAALGDAQGIIGASRRGQLDVLIYTGAKPDDLERVLKATQSLGLKRICLTGFSSYGLSGWIQQLMDAYGMESVYLEPGESIALGGFSMEAVPGGIKVKRGEWALAYGAADPQADVRVLPEFGLQRVPRDGTMTVFGCPYRVQGLDERGQNLYNNARSGAWRRIWAGNEE